MHTCLAAKMCTLPELFTTPVLVVCRTCIVLQLCKFRSESKVELLLRQGGWPPLGCCSLPLFVRTVCQSDMQWPDSTPQLSDSRQLWWVPSSLAPLGRSGEWEMGQVGGAPFYLPTE